MRFNQVFYILLILAAISAFVLPSRMTQGARPLVGTLLTPVAQPSRAVASWATGRWGTPPGPIDQRAPDQIVAENQELRLANVKLEHDLVELRKINNEREKLGDIRELCTPVPVLGNEDQLRDSLAIRSSTMTGLQDGMFVLYNRDIVGTLVAGKAGAQVRLVTDPQSRVQAYFTSFKKSATPGSKEELPTGRLTLPSRVIEGAGRGKMICRYHPYADVQKSGLAVGDWAVVDDRTWHKKLQGRRLGVVTKISKGDKMMAEIEIRPESQLLLLTEVMVLNKDK